MAVLSAFATSASTAAWANPTGGNVVAGSATITSAGKTLTVNQSSNRAIINWQGFSIGAGETTRLNLPSSTSAILNRVISANPSLIAGSLSSNGQVYLINPNGIVVGPNGRINTAGFVASTLNVPNDAFMAGGGLTFKGDSGAGIQILGSITASDGDVVLIAAMVDNQGHIAAPNGQAILGSGGEVYYIPDGQSDIVIKASANGGGSVSNSGTIAAASVQMKAAGSPYALAVNNSSLVTATGISQRGGRIVLDGGDGDVVQSGTLTAAGGNATVNGGQVTVSGAVDVSAPNGGGSIAVTGSKKATVAATAKLRASATTAGNGGKITVKSAGSADVGGSLEAKGGPQGGDGGSAEVSAHDVAFSGSVDTTAPQGKTGSFLLDPTDITLCNFFCGTSPLILGIQLLTTDVTVSATNSITLNDAISSAGAHTLDFDAPNTTLNAGIALGNGTLSFTNTSGTNGGTLSSAAGATISANEINVTGNYAAVNLAGAVNAGTDLHISQIFTGTSVTVNNAANVIPTLSFIGGDTITGSFDFATTTALTVKGALQAGTATILSFGDLTMFANSGIGANGTKTLGSINGTFKNLEGAALFSGTGRNLIYAATDVGLDQGGLGYTQYNPVAIGSDPAHGLSGVVYLQHSSLPVMTVTADNASTVYGVAPSGYSASVSGGTGGDLASPVQFRVLGGGTNVGTYALQPFGAISSTRALSFVNGTLTVNPALLTVRANDVRRLQGAGAPAFSASYSGLVNGDTTDGILVNFQSQGGSSSPPGTYSIQPSGFSRNANYTLQFVNGTLTIAPAPPPPLNPFSTTTVTYIPGTLNPTTTITTTETLKTTTLTPGEINPTGPAITVDVLRGTPLEGFGPLAEDLLDDLAKASKTPDTASSQIMIALRNPQTSPQIMLLLSGLMYAELDTILNKDQSTWTPDEKTFVQAFMDYINAQRASAANKAMADYETWAKATVAEEDAKIKGMTGIAQMTEMSILSTMPPLPPTDLLSEVSYGMTLSDAQADGMLAQLTAAQNLESGIKQTETGLYSVDTAGYLAQVTGFNVDSSQAAKLFGNRLGKAIFPEVSLGDQLATSREKKSGGGDINTGGGGKGAKAAEAAGDILEAAGRVASVLSVFTEVAGAVLQIGLTAQAYSDQAKFNNDFTTAVNSALTPISVADLKTMVSSGKAMSYMMAMTAGGNPDVIDNSFSSAKPDMPLNQIVNITKNL